MPPAEITTRDTNILITKGHHQHFEVRTRRIHRVPEILRHNKKEYYTPKFVSFGPYYHNLPQLGNAEKFKHEVLEMFVSKSSSKDKQFFYSQIFEVVHKIRNCYVGVSYDDGALAEMMLLDASFAIYAMKYHSSDKEITFHVSQHLGKAVMAFAFEDMYLLENQIPLWVIMLLIKLINGKEEEGPELVRNFLSNLIPEDTRVTRFSVEDENPLHLLDAIHRIILVEELDSAKERIEESTEVTEQNPNGFGKYNHQSRSATDLKAKGIYFKPSSKCLKNIEFKSHTFYGKLQMPIWFFNSFSKLFFTHLIAYEVSQENNVCGNITCYVNFLKSLIVKPEDVKELREKKIIFSSLDSDEQILEVIKEIDTCGIETDYIFNAVKMGIDEHCRSKAKTWIAELFHTYFRSPWKFIALLAATTLLVLTFIQTFT